ncbi:MAG TPA: beta galactosidase jelly roll domain-containing protein [Balneolales bacterium]|nr:beta galactosidase jelly roll domain-containing protein [Balneolales bacterium]
MKVIKKDIIINLMRFIQGTDMKYFLKIITVFLFLIPFSVSAQQKNRKIELRKFVLQSSDIIKANGAELSAANYQSKDYWFPVNVPSTVLYGLVANKVYPNPYIGMNNMYIPDASDSFNTKYNLSQYSYLPNKKNPWKDPYWYRTQFTVPQNYTGKRVWLTFKGVNYRADVWLNGKQVADTSKMVGMFEQYRFDVTNKIIPNGKNYLAVKIYPLDHPCLPAPPQLKALGPFYANGGPRGDIGKNVTMLCSVGWDWVPAARGREMGIWQPVYLSTSGSVTVDAPHIVSDLPKLPDTTKAALTLGMTLVNHSDKSQKGRLQVTIQPDNFKGASIHFTRNENLKAGETRDVTLSPDQIRQLTITNPHLWWPSGYGRANLYKISLKYVTGKQTSDVSNTVFGIRTVSSKVTADHGWGRRDFYVNGQRIHLVGGAWVPDLLLHRNAARYAKELELIKNDNLNLVRIWGGGIAPPDDFFKAADRLGLLVWQDFWITGDTQGGFKGSSDWPLQGNVFIRNMKSTILRLRNHPSLLVWTGGNEGHARKVLYDAMRNDVKNMDGTRPFIPSSSGFDKLPKGWKGSWPDNKTSGVYSGGPYTWVNPVNYYNYVNKGRPTKDPHKRIWDWVFKDEVGVPSQPTYSSLKKMIPNLVPDTTLPFPLNNTWGYHDACAGNGKYQIYYKAIVDRYGKPESFRDYSEKAQLVNANSYRAIFEAANSKLTETGGVLLWKLNSAWPSVMWQIYDWYLNPNAGYYYAQKANELLHVQFNLNDSTVVVVNKNHKSRTGLTVNMSLYNAQGKKWYSHEQKINAGSYNVTQVISLESTLTKHNELTFVGLSMRDRSGKVVSHNFYWLAPDNKFQVLNKLPRANLNISVSRVSNAKVPTWKIYIQNPTDRIAFFIHTKLTTHHGKKEVLPSYWNDNYVNLVPHEKRTLFVHTFSADKRKKTHQIVISGWNVARHLVVTTNL